MFVQLEFFLQLFEHLWRPRERVRREGTNCEMWKNDAKREWDASRLTFFKGFKICEIFNFIFLLQFWHRSISFSRFGAHGLREIEVAFEMVLDEAKHKRRWAKIPIQESFLIFCNNRILKVQKNLILEVEIPRDVMWWPTDGCPKNNGFNGEAQKKFAQFLSKRKEKYV